MANLSKFHVVFSSSTLIRLNKDAFEGHLCQTVNNFVKLTYNNSDNDEDDTGVHYPCDSCLFECERCFKWLCVKYQKVPKAMINVGT